MLQDKAFAKLENLSNTNKNFEMSVCLALTTDVDLVQRSRVELHLTPMTLFNQSNNS